MLTVCSRTHPERCERSTRIRALWDPDIATWPSPTGWAATTWARWRHSWRSRVSGIFLRRAPSTSDFTWPFGVSPTLSFAANRLMTAIKVANRRVFRASEERSEYTGMGTTVVAAIVEGAASLLGRRRQPHLFVRRRTS